MYLLSSDKYSYGCKYIEAKLCGRTREECMSDFVYRQNEMCRYHAEDEFLSNGIHIVELEDETAVQVTRECILDLLLNGNELPKPGASIRVLKKAE